MHVASRLPAFDHLTEAVEVQLALEAAEFVVCGECKTKHNSGERVDISHYLFIIPLPALIEQ